MSSLGINSDYVKDSINSITRKRNMLISFIVLLKMVFRMSIVSSLGVEIMKGTNWLLGSVEYGRVDYHATCVVKTCFPLMNFVWFGTVIAYVWFRQWWIRNSLYKINSCLSSHYIGEGYGISITHTSNIYGT